MEVVFHLFLVKVFDIQGLLRFFCNVVIDIYLRLQIIIFWRLFSKLVDEVW